jgi:hypothetical protein
VCIRFPTKKAEIGEPVEVEVTSTTNWIPILNTGATSTTIKGTAVMRLEAPPTTYGEECA